MVVSAMFLSREPIRRACLRADLYTQTNRSDPRETDAPSINSIALSSAINLSWLVIPIGAIVTLLAYIVFGWWMSPVQGDDLNLSPYLVETYNQALLLYSK